MSQQSNSDGPSRRSCLASFGAGATVALSGCIETLPPLGQQIRFGRIDVPEPAPQDYRTWIPAPSALPDGYGAIDTEEVPIHAGQPRASRESGYSGLHHSAEPDWLGTPYRNYERAINVGRTFVFEGDTGPDVVADAVDDTGYEPAGTYEGYDLYERSDGPRTIAVADRAVCWTRGDRGRAVIEAVIDARAGHIDRRHEVDERFEAMTEAVGLTDFVAIDGLHITLDAVADALTTGMSITYRAGTRYTRSQALFEESEDVPERRIRRELRANETATAADAVDVRTEGRRAIVEVQIDDDRAGDERHVPQITWGVSHDPDHETVTLRHEAGETVAADELEVSVWRRHAANDDGEPEPRFSDHYEQVGPGDTLDVPAGWRTTSVAIEYRTPERAVRLFSYDLE